jgi:RimJ/RimL family protein N-acetyltransferase
MPPPKSIAKQLETKRLILRVPSLRDATRLNAEVRLSMARLAPWIPWAKQTPTLAKSRRFCARMIKDHRARKNFGFIILAKDTGDLVGGIGLHRVDWNIPKLEIGYWIGTRFEGRGFVTEAVRALTDFAFQKLGAIRMELLCDGRNTKSRKVARRAGYRLEGIHRKAKRNNAGKLCDMCVFARTRPKKSPTGRRSRPVVRTAR